WSAASSTPTRGIAGLFAHSRISSARRSTSWPAKAKSRRSQSRLAHARAGPRERPGSGPARGDVVPRRRPGRPRNAEGRLVQPALKCRGREYLRIIYGPEYSLPEHLSRLRARGVGAKRGLATREFALGLEALERFVGHQPLRRVHECVFGVLALESEPV